MKDQYHMHIMLMLLQVTILHYVLNMLEAEKFPGLQWGMGAVVEMRTWGT